MDIQYWIEYSTSVWYTVIFFVYSKSTLGWTLILDLCSTEQQQQGNAVGNYK
jgi:hypothetical protein